MPKNPKLYSPENVEKARYAQIVVTILAVAISGYLGLSTFLGIRQVWNTQRMLVSTRHESTNLSRKAAALTRKVAKMPRSSDGGIDTFALQLSRWATEQGIDVESVTPQGAPIANDVMIGKENLGTWNMVKVRVAGNGDYARVISLMNRFRNPGLPVQLDSFSFRGKSESDTINFDLTLTVYARQSRDSS